MVSTLIFQLLNPINSILNIKPKFHICQDRMDSYLKNRFHHHLDTIQSLQRSSDKFWELCMNYEEICTWLAAKSSETEMTTEEHKAASELIQELEKEIEAVIKSV